MVNGGGIWFVFEVSNILINMIFHPFICVNETNACLLSPYNVGQIMNVQSHSIWYEDLPRYNGLMRWFLNNAFCRGATVHMIDTRINKKRFECYHIIYCSRLNAWKPLQTLFTDICTRNKDNVWVLFSGFNGLLKDDNSNNVNIIYKLPSVDCPKV